MNWVDALHEMRRSGWSVAVHNDYEQNGMLKTFWLLTHKASGLFVKGEGLTDQEAVTQCAEQAKLIFRPSP